jgi:hypothetical protein
MDGMNMGTRSVLRRATARRAAAALFIAVTALFLALSSCSDALLDEMSRLATEANKPESLPLDKTIITAHETITLTLAHAEVGSTILLLGSIWRTVAPPASTLGADKKIVLNGGAPAVAWKAGTGLTLGVRVTSAGQETTYTYTFDVFNGAYVSDPSTPRSPGSAGASGAPGTWLNPLDTIQAGIDKANTTYVGAGKGPAEVRVARCPIGSPYSASCAVGGGPVYVANMKADVSVKGGYALDFASRNPAGAPSYIKDVSTDAVGSTTSNPVRAVNASGATITTATVFDGFTITLGAGGGGGTAHSGIACLSGASPTISNVVILGRADSEKSADAYGIYLSGSSAVISACSIDPGSSSNQSTGINAANGASAPTIQNSTIGGGKSLVTVGVWLDGNVNAAVSSNNISGGLFTVAGGMGVCVFLQTANATNADITGNNLTPSDLPRSATTYGVYVTTGSNPHQLRNNDFNYDGYWYYIEATTTTIGSGNYLSVDVTTVLDGTNKLFNATWGNHSTATNKP